MTDDVEAEMKYSIKQKMSDRIIDAIIGYSLVATAVGVLLVNLI